MFLPSQTIKADKTPPTITLLGDGTMALLSSGEATMMNVIPFGHPWQDPGAKATDVDAYGVTQDLTGAITAMGVGAVDPWNPTAPGRNFSYIITYSVSTCCWCNGCDGQPQLQ